MDLLELRVLPEKPRPLEQLGALEQLGEPDLRDPPVLPQIREPLEILVRLGAPDLKAPLVSLRTRERQEPLAELVQLVCREFQEKRRIRELLGPLDVWDLPELTENLRTQEQLGALDLLVLRVFLE